jgi:hypothetical protein
MIRWLQAVRSYGYEPMSRVSAVNKVLLAAFSILMMMTCASCNTSPTPLPTTQITSPRKEVLTMKVIIQVSADVARALRQRSPPIAESEELLRIIETLGLRLEPMHHDADDPNLQTYFTVEVQDQATAQRVIDRLQQLEGIEAAYVKPPDELP